MSSSFAVSSTGATHGIACGACWESVIRADERRSLLERSAASGLCSLCDAPTGAPPADTEAVVG